MLSSRQVEFFAAAGAWSCFRVGEARRTHTEEIIHMHVSALVSGRNALLLQFATEVHDASPKSQIAPELYRGRLKGK